MCRLPLLVLLLPRKWFGIAPDCRRRRRLIMTFIRDVGRTCEWSGAKEGGRAGAGSRRPTTTFCLSPQWSGRFWRTDGRTDGTDAAFQCNITVLTPGSLGRQIALHVQVRVWEVPWFALRLSTTYKGRGEKFSGGHCIHNFASELALGEGELSDGASSASTYEPNIGRRRREGSRVNPSPNV